MANFTTNFNLKKPLGGEVYNIEDDNGNMDILDGAVPAIANNLTETVAGKALDATQGKVLQNTKQNLVLSGATQFAQFDVNGQVEGTNFTFSNLIDELNTKVVKVASKSLVLDTEITKLNAISGSNTGDQTLAGLNGASLLVTEVSVTASRTLILTDKDNKLIACNHASVAIVNTIPPNSSVAFPIGSQFAFSRDGLADVSVALGADVTITNTAKLKIANQGESMALVKTGTDTYKLFGSLKA